MVLYRRKLFMETAGIHEKKKQGKKTLFLLFTFFLMCIAKLWFTMFILFAFAVILTALQGRAGYCAYYCPMATLQQGFYRKKNHFHIGKKWMTGAFFYPMAILFWGGAVSMAWFFRYRPLTLWFAILQLMMAMVFIALVSQSLFGKGFFCGNLCPLRIPVLKNVIRIRRSLSR